MFGVVDRLRNERWRDHLPAGGEEVYIFTIAFTMALNLTQLSIQ